MNLRNIKDHRTGWLKDLKPFDWIYIGNNVSSEITKVQIQKISPTGFIFCEGIKFRPDGTKKTHTTFTVKILGPSRELEKEWERTKKLEEVRKCFEKIDEVSDEVLDQLVEVLARIAQEKTTTPEEF